MRLTTTSGQKTFCTHSRKCRSEGELARQTNSTLKRQPTGERWEAGGLVRGTPVLMAWLPHPCWQGRHWRLCKLHRAGKTLVWDPVCKQNLSERPCGVHRPRGGSYSVRRVPQEIQWILNCGTFSVHPIQQADLPTIEIEIVPSVEIHLDPPEASAANFLFRYLRKIWVKS